MGRCLRPRGEFVSAYTGFNLNSSVGTLNRSNSVDDEAGIDRWG